MKKLLVTRDVTWFAFAAVFLSAVNGVSRE